MDNVNQVGKKLGKTKKESAFNIRRAAENFPTPERGVKDFNPLFTYEKTFSASPNAQVFADIQLRDITTPCTVNPPTSGIWCTGKLSTTSESSANCEDSVNAFYMDAMLNTTNLINPTGDFIFSSGSITVPVDGCYSITWSSSASGLSYHNDRYIQAVFLHNDLTVTTVNRIYTGIIAIMGPWIYVYPAITHVYKVLEAKAGDTISAALYELCMRKCRPWVAGVCLRGGFSQSGTQIRIDLIAEAEDA